MEKMPESINKDREEIQKNMHTETSNTITEIQNLEGISSRISEAEEPILELEERMVEIIVEQQNKVKGMKKKNTEDSLRDLLDNIKCTNI